MQYEQKKNKRKATEHDQGLNEQHGRPDEDVNIVEVFKDFHTSTKQGLTDAARVTVVNTLICFP